MRENDESNAGKRNINILKNAFGKDSICIVNIYYYKLKIYGLLNNLLGFSGGLDIKKIKKIKKIVKDDPIDVIFLNASFFGKIAKLLQCTNVPIITMFHNVEIFLFEQRIIHFNIMIKILYNIQRKSILSSEKDAVKYSNGIITYNKRDSDGLKKIYNRSADLIFPMSFYDCYDENMARKYDVVENNKMLFVGTDFYGNTEGLFWFIENCIDKINAELIVVGRGMEKYRDRYISQNVKFIGYVDDIAEIYYQSDIVVLPIISGSGMKTKTCEALMYGKTIFGTDEAFMGYDALDLINNDWLCNTADDFIKKINSHFIYKSSRINNYARLVYLKNYASTLLESVIKNFIMTKILT
jgi:hypothetical protein